MNEMRLIDANELKPISVSLDGKILFIVTLSEVHNTPTVDAVPVVHGHWIPVEGETGVEAFGIKEIQICGFKCSGCNFEIDISEREFNYCPNCGAKMSEESAE